MKKNVKSVLVIGYGNPGRLDDGLGPAFVELLERLGLPDHVTVDSDYQLVVEDASRIAEHDVVVFVDASVSCSEPFLFERVEPQMNLSFSSHSMTPGGLLGLAQELFGSEPEGYVLAIRGYEFNEFGEHLSAAAQENLSSALEFFCRIMVKGRFSQAAQKAVRRRA